MLSRILIPLLLMAGLALAQSSKDMDTLMARYYQPLGITEYECAPVFLFPHFALDEPAPPLMARHEGYTKDKGFETNCKGYKNL